VGDVFAGEGIEDERVVDGPTASIGAIDFGQSDDFSDVSASVEASREQALVIRRRLAR